MPYLFATKIGTNWFIINNKLILLYSVYIFEFIVNPMPLNLIRPLVFFDLETTGTKVDEDRIVEISLLKLFPDGKEEAKSRAQRRHN